MGYFIDVSTAYVRFVQNLDEWEFDLFSVHEPCGFVTLRQILFFTWFPLSEEQNEYTCICSLFCIISHLKCFFFFIQNLDEWEFDVFSVNEAGDGHALKYVGYELLQRYDLINKLKVSEGSRARNHFMNMNITLNQIKDPVSFFLFDLTNTLKVTFFHIMYQNKKVLRVQTFISYKDLMQHRLMWI